MKINELQRQIEVLEEDWKSKAAAIAAAGSLAMAPVSTHHNIKQSSEIHQTQKELPGAKPFYKIGAPYVSHGKRYVPKFNPHYEKVGVASWYGPGFQGKKTANGDIFNTHSLQAASPTLPLPSKVWVTNLENGKKVMVTVTDRGPYAKNRIIDLSMKAAKELGYFHKGTAKVKVQYDPKATVNYLKKIGLYDQYREVNDLPPTEADVESK